MSFSLGSNAFVAWRGTPPQLVKQHVSTFTRAGLAGISAIALGVHGDPFEFESLAYFPNQSAAQTAAASYRSLIGGSPVVAVYAGVNYSTTHGHTYLVLDVELASLQPIPLFFGGGTLYAPAWPVVARWRLVPIA